MENNKKTKEINLEKDTSKKTKEVKTKKEENKEEKASNSFYEETSALPSVKWYKDWRGKTLILVLIGAILIGGGIPAGMAMTGYWKKFHGDEIPYNPSDYEKLLNEVKIKTNTAYIDHLEQMTSEGWFTESQNKLIVKNAKNDADDQIKNEKKSVKDQYGKVWEDAWNKQLQGKGFDNESQYKDSIIADKYKSKELSQYTDVSNVVKKSSDAPTAKYKSDEALRGGHWQYINNAVPNGDFDLAPKYILTSEKLMDIFIVMYQPILFNDTLLEFTPSKGQDGEADIAATTISITNDQILNALDMYYNLTDSSYEQFSNNYDDVMSFANLSFEDNVSNVSINQEIVDGGSSFNRDNGFDLKTIIVTAFKDAGYPNIDKLSKDDIDAFTSDQDDKFGESLKESLESSGVIGSKRKPIKWSPSNSDKNFLSFVSTDGLHSVGIQNQDDSLVSDYLNIKNKSDGWIDLASSSIDTKYTEWVSSNFDDIILLSYMAKTFSEEGTILKKSTLSLDAQIIVETIIEIIGKSLQQTIDKKNEAKTLYTDNFEYYDLPNFDEASFLIGLMKNSNILNKTFFSSMYNKEKDLNNEIVKGGYNEK